MTIANLEERSLFWGTLAEESYGGGSISQPFFNHLDFFIDKDVLEIGPGGGRQFSALFDKAKSYAVADISQLVLDKPLYRNCNRHLISSYDDILDVEFDTVHFWYVVHHIIPNELPAFARFVASILRKDGRVIFNTVDDRTITDTRDNGIQTSHHAQATVLDVFAQYFADLNSTRLDRDCVVISGRKA